MLPALELLIRYYVYASAFESGYISIRNWSWFSPALLQVLFASNHGLLLWTPILLFTIIGLFLFSRREPAVGIPFLAAFLAFYIFIACYPDWAGISSFGHRLFISLIPLFIVGLSLFLHRAAEMFRSRRATFATISAVLALFVLWNAGLMFQWGSHLVPARGPASLSQTIHNHFFVVPRQFTDRLRTYFFRGRKLMQQIEKGDIEQLNKSYPTN